MKRQDNKSCERSNAGVNTYISYLNTATTLYRSAVASEAEVTMDSYLMAESAVLNNEFENEVKAGNNKSKE